MGRAVDQDVHQAFVEFKSREEDKCMSVQCIYCHQIRAKNTSRQKQHLLECPGLQNNNNATANASRGGGGGGSTSTSNDVLATSSNTTTFNPSTSLTSPTNNAPLSNGLASHTTPIPSLANRPSLPLHASSSSQPLGQTPPILNKAVSKPAKVTPSAGGISSLPAPPLEDVHAAFLEFRAKDEDKCLSVQCMYCSQIRAKNTSRQRQHLQECAAYQNVMKEAIPANNLLHRFEEGEVARSLQIPTPSLELDFRMSVKLNPKLSVGPGVFGQKNWISFIGGSWAGRWGKGIVIPGGQDDQVVVKDLSARLKATYLLQTNDDPPAFITVKSRGWRTGSKEVLEKLGDPAQADTVAANQYKFRLNLQLETGDERYMYLNTLMWVGSGARRGAEVIYDAYRIG